VDFFKGLAAEKMLGEGAFGKVFLYQYESTGERVAIKFINEKDDLGNDIARLMALSSSPKCSRYVVCYEGHAIVPNPSGKFPRELFAIKMSYVDGPTLQDVSVPTKEKNRTVHRLLRNALKALEYVHSKNIVHGDLKPENMIVRSGTQSVVLIDFGLACKPPCEPETAGTPDYMAPEQLDPQNMPRSKAADVFSLAASFFYLVLGKDRSSRDDELKKFDTESRMPAALIPWTRDGLRADETEHSAAMTKLDFYTNSIENQYGRVLKSMLAWNHEARPTASEALSQLPKN
jgi:serine/threonine protein kinase